MISASLFLHPHIIPESILFNFGTAEQAKWHQREKWVNSTRLAVLSKSMEGERTKQRDSPQGDAGMGPQLVYAHRHKHNTPKREPDDARVWERS